MARYRSMRVEISHPLAIINRSLSADGTTVHIWEHRKVLWDKIGPGTHPCHWCGKVLDWFSEDHTHQLVTDHVNRDQRDNRPENLVPACFGCNALRDHPQTLQPGELSILRPSGRRLRAEELTCPRCGARYLSPTAKGMAKKTCGPTCRYR